MSARATYADAPGLLVARGGIEPPTYRFSGGRSYQLSYLANPTSAGETSPTTLATLTGLEPATFAVTGRRANQPRHRAIQSLTRNNEWNSSRQPTHPIRGALH